MNFRWERLRYVINKDSNRVEKLYRIMSHRFLKLFFFLIVGVFFLHPHSFAFADDQYFGLDETAGSAGLTQTAPSDVPTLIGNIIGTLLSLIGVIFFVLMVYGGFLWMTAHGDSAQVDKGKETIIAAVIGLVVVLASYALTTFVFNAPTGGNSGSGGNGGGSPTTQGTAPTSNLTVCCLFKDGSVNKVAPEQCDATKDANIAGIKEPRLENGEVFCS